MKAIIFRDWKNLNSALNYVVLALSFLQLLAMESFLGFDTTINTLAVLSGATTLIMLALPTAYVYSDHTEGVVIILRCSGVSVLTYFVAKMILPLAFALSEVLLNMVFLAYAATQGHGLYDVLVRLPPMFVLTGCMAIATMSVAIAASYVGKNVSAANTFAGTCFGLLFVAPILLLYSANLINALVCSCILLVEFFAAVICAKCVVSRRNANVLQHI